MQQKMVERPKPAHVRGRRMVESGGAFGVDGRFQRDDRRSIGSRTEASFAGPRHDDYQGRLRYDGY